jgi:hypothetical protein
MKRNPFDESPQNEGCRARMEQTNTLELPQPHGLKNEGRPGASAQAALTYVKKENLRPSSF